MTLRFRSEKRIREHVTNLGNQDTKVASRAEGYLIRYYGARALGPLLDACDHSDPTVRFRAVWALASTKDPRAYEAVLRLTNDSDETVRYDATLALGVLGDDRAIAPLVAMALEDDATRPAEVALRDFGERAIDSYRTLIRTGDAQVRCGAIQCLGVIALQHNSRECQDMLRECLSDPDESVRENARDWLENQLQILDQNAT